MILQKKFYERETVIVAKQLLGKTLTRKIRGRKLTGIITETEAYRGKDDTASHAAVKMTPRNKVMFGQVGVSYVYFTYGMYFMLNVVAKSKKQNAGAILIRGMYPQNGIEIMKKNRGVNETQNISNGPGKLTIALGITMKHHNKDLTDNSELSISDGIKPKKSIKNLGSVFLRALKNNGILALTLKITFDHHRLLTSKERIVLKHDSSPIVVKLVLLQSFPHQILLFQLILV